VLLATLAKSGADRNEFVINCRGSKDRDEMPPAIKLADLIGWLSTLS
jgi:hypothetical protein